jgi:hypothetical protein
MELGKPPCNLPPSSTGRRPQAAFGPLLEHGRDNSSVISQNPGIKQPESASVDRHARHVREPASRQGEVLDLARSRPGIEVVDEDQIGGIVDQQLVDLGDGLVEGGLLKRVLRNLQGGVDFGIAVVAPVRSARRHQIGFEPAQERACRILHRRRQ